MFNVDTAKKPRSIKKPIPIRINKNKIELKGSLNLAVEVKPKITNSDPKQNVSVIKEPEIQNDIMFEIY